MHNNQSIIEAFSVIAREKNIDRTNLGTIIEDLFMTLIEKKYGEECDNFSVIVNQGPGSFSRSRISLSVAKGLKITKKVKLFGYRNNDLKVFDQQNIENLFHANLIEKKLIKPIYLS